MGDIDKARSVNILIDWFIKTVYDQFISSDNDQIITFLKTYLPDDTSPEVIAMLGKEIYGRMDYNFNGNRVKDAVHYLNLVTLHGERPNPCSYSNRQIAFTWPPSENDNGIGVCPDCNSIQFLNLISLGDKRHGRMPLHVAKENT